MQGKIVPRAKFSLGFIIGGGVLIVLGLLLQFAVDLSKVIFDLPVIMIGLGIIVAIYGGIQYSRRATLGDVTFSKKAAKAFLTNYAIILALLVLVVIICIKERRFMQVRVILDILSISSTRLIIALGICFTLLIAGTDLSAGRMVGLAAVISCSMLQTATYANRFYPDLPQVPIILPILLAIIACMFFGTLNGFLVAKYDMHPFIATLAVQVIVYGATSLYFDLPPNNSQPLGGIRSDFSALGLTKLGEIRNAAGQVVFPGISILVPIALVVLVIIWFVLNKTVFGKNVYAIGGNQAASQVSGINVKKYKNLAFALCASLAALTGVLMASRLGSAHPTGGDGLFLQSYAAAFLGRTVFREGVPNIWGTFVGAAILGVLANGLTILQVPTFMQDLLTGCIIILAVVVQKIGRGDAK